MCSDRPAPQGDHRRMLQQQEGILYHSLSTPCDQIVLQGVNGAIGLYAHLDQPDLSVVQRGLLDSAQHTTDQVAAAAGKSVGGDRSFSLDLHLAQKQNAVAGGDAGALLRLDDGARLLGCVMVGQWLCA